MVKSNRFESIVFGGLVILLFSPILQADANEEVQQIEEAILDYYKYTNGFVWKWNSEEVKLASIPGTSESAKYGALCSTRGSILTEIRGLVMKNIVLVTQNCARVPMEILEGICTTTEVFHNGAKAITNLDLGFLRGPNGEIYYALKWRTECDDRDVLAIRHCVHDGNSFMHDVSEIENLFLSSSNQPSSREWNSPESTCQLLHPDLTQIKLNMMTATLESKECTEIPVLVLRCICSRNEESYAYVKDLYNAVYELKNSDMMTKCNKPQGLTIRKRVIDSHNRLVQPICPM